MKPRLEELPTSDSPLARVDPRWKLAGLLLAMLAVLLLRTLPAAACAFACALVLTSLSRLPARWYLARIGAVAALLILFVLLLPFLVPDRGRYWDLGIVRLSLPGIQLAFLVSCKTLALASLIMVLLATAPLTTTLKAADHLHVPSLLIQLVMLAYRYIYLLASELGRLRIALRVRGYRNRMTRHSYRTAGHIAGTLLVRGYERAERVGHAMRCRGFDGRFRSLADFRTTSTDMLAFFSFGAVAAALLIWDWLSR